MNYFLGVDGGQSSTTALIGDETGRVAGYARGGPCNHVSAGESRAKFLNAVGGAVTQACAQAGIEPRFAAACLGFSGGPADKESLVHEFLSAERLEVTHDALIALSGACAGAPGIVVIAGTGSIAFGRNRAGESARAGGWGHIFGDEGGAFSIVRNALRAALRHEEGWGPKTLLRERLLNATGARDANELLHWFYAPEYPRSRVATYATLVDQAAREGDGEAIAVLREASGALAGFVTAIDQQLFAPLDEPRVSFIGGVFRSALLLERFSELVLHRPAAVLCPPVHGPAAGALIEAYRLAGRSPELTNLPESEK